MKFALWLSLLATISLAQPLDYSTGGNLKRRMYQTYDTVTLFVDPTGSDENSCTASGTDACLTLAGAYAQLPRFIRNTTTISVAAGAYATTFSAPDVNISTGITLSVAGTLSAFVPATGTASGTLTASTAGSAVGPSTATDGTQTWTINNLRGAFIRFNSGTLSGQILPISANTATTVSFPSTSAAGLVTYDILTPGSTFITTATASLAGPAGAGTFSVSNVRIERTNGSAISTVNTAPTTLQNVLVLGSTSGITLNGGPLRIFRTFVQGTAVAGFSMGALLGANPPWCSSCNNNVFKSGSSAAYQTGTGSLGSTISTSVFENSSTSIPAVSINGSASTSTQFLSLWVTCTGGAGSIGIGSFTLGQTAPPSSTQFACNASRVTGCETGVRVEGPNYWVFHGTAFDTATTAFAVNKGATLDLIAGTPTFTTVTNELQQDGTNYTFAFLNGLAAPQVISNSYGSTIIR